MKKVIKPLVMIFLIMNLSGCGMMMMQQQQQEQNDFSEQQESTSSDSDLSSDAGSGQNGSESFFEGEKRIVSLIPSNTEILSELGLDEEIVGITTVDTYPEDLVNDPDISKLDAFEFDIEQLLALEPTHILSHESSRAMQGNVLEQITKETDAEVIYIEEAATVDAISDTIMEIGEFVGEPDKALEVSRSLEEDIEEVVEHAGDIEEHDAFIQISRSPEVYTTGNNTFLHDVLKKMDIKNTFQDLNGFVSVSFEEVIDRNPDYIVSISGISDQELNAEVADFQGIENLTIQSEDRQCTIDPDILSRPGPRISEGLTELLECLKN